MRPPWLMCFIIKGLIPIIPFTYFIPSFPTPSPQATYPFFLCICECFHFSLFCFFSSVQSLSRVQLFVLAACQPSLSIINSRRWLKLMSIELVMPFNHFILCHPLLLLPSSFPSIGVFSNKSVLSHQVAKVLEFQLQHQLFQ